MYIYIYIYILHHHHRQHRHHHHEGLETGKPEVQPLSMSLRKPADRLGKVVVANQVGIRRYGVGLDISLSGLVFWVPTLQSFGDHVPLDKKVSLGYRFPPGPCDRVVGGLF